MNSDQPQEQIDPAQVGRDWLYAFERLVRDRNFIEAGNLFHKNCVYFGLEDDRRTVDWAETWKNQLAFSIDMAQTKIICEGNMFLVCGPWVAQGLIHGSPQKIGRLTIGLMQFSNKKLLAVHAHVSYQPQPK